VDQVVAPQINRFATTQQAQEREKRKASVQSDFDAVFGKFFIA
jgi:hypothetical protein